MGIKLINLFNNRLEASLHNAYKVHFFYFLLFFSAVLILLFPLSIKNNMVKPGNMLFTSIVLGIILYIIYIIYLAGGFNV